MSETSPSTGTDWAVALAELKEQREAIDAAIAGIEIMMRMRPGGPKSPSEPAAPQQNGLGPGAFLGMTVADAAKKYLAHKRQTQKTEEILNALRQGGIVLTSQDPLNTVGSTLLRNWQSGGDIVRVDRGVWGLAEWHPRLRQRAKATGRDLDDVDPYAGMRPEEIEEAKKGQIDPLS